MLLERPRDGVAVVRLNRPESLNAIDQQMMDGLHAAIDAVNADRSCRAVVLTGEGGGFCSGLDLNAGHFALPGTEDMAEVPRLLRLQEAIVALVERIHESPKPFIAAVNGAATGGGFALALACDIRVVSDNARLGAVFIKVGAQNADLGISYLLPRIVGAGRSAELLLTGRLLGAEEADRIGLVSAVARPADLLARALELAEVIAANGAFQLWMTKTTMWHSLGAPSLRHAILTENRTQIMTSMAGDVEEAFNAFREGRKPEWRAM
ncbi:MAG TPA: enoyl-CoA hydratase/isomerase family protein [Pseudonocardia sp.]